MTITEADIDNAIVHAEINCLAGLASCTLTLRNGLTARGEAGKISSRFAGLAGTASLKRQAHLNAREQVRHLLSLILTDRLSADPVEFQHHG